MPLTLATWNVNSLKVRLPHLLDWLARTATDVVCLQETKLTDDKFPQAELQAAGYRSVFAGQRTYNGVAILLREELSVGAIADKVALSQSALSQHLAKLRSLDLVDTRRDKQTIYYSCKSEAVRQVLLTLDSIFGGS